MGVVGLSLHVSIRDFLLLPPLQVADALLALHSQDPPLAHCDVKPLNVLVQARMTHEE